MIMYTVALFNCQNDLLTSIFLSLDMEQPHTFHMKDTSIL